MSDMVMKAPDKIYIHARTEPYPSLTWSEVKEKNVTNEEYISKDALLEWANAHKIAIETNGEEDDAYTRGQYSVILALIDKLNSM